MAHIRKSVLPSEVLFANKDKVLEVIKSFSCENPSVFGSVARGEDRKTSDIDLLVEFPENFSILDRIGLRQELEDLLGVRVDVGSLDDLPPKKRDKIGREAVVL